MTVDTIFLKLLNMSIAAGWLILAVLVLRLLIKKAPRWINCLLWAAVAVRLVCPFSLESTWSLIPSAETVVSGAVQDDVGQGNVIRKDTVLEKHEDAVQGVQNGIVQNAQNDLRAFVPVIHSGVTVIDRTVNSVLSESFAADSAKSGTGSDLWHNWTQIGAVVWLSVAGCILLYALVSFLRLKRKVKASILLHDNVYVCDEITSPFILGIIKPHIYLPSGMDSETERYVIAHENTHLRRHDHWWKPFGYILLAVYWFHPLSWIAYILFCRDIELACDEQAVQTMEREDKASYAQALLDCSFSRRMVVACPLAFGEIGVKERVKAVLNYKRPAFWIIVVALVACAAVAVCFLTDPKEAEAGRPTEMAHALLIGDDIAEKYYPEVIDTDAEDSDTEDYDASYGLDTPIDNGNWFTLELPDGYTVSGYHAEIGFYGGKLIEPQAYEILGDSQSRPIEWTMSGFIGKIANVHTFFTFQYGQIDNMLIISNHTLQEMVETLEGLDMRAVLCSVSHDLYSAEEMGRLEEQGISIPYDQSSYWYIFFAREDVEEGFYLALDQNQFSKEEAIEIARSVKFDLDMGPIVEVFVPDPPVTTTKSVDFAVGAPAVDKQIFDWTDSQVLEAAEAYRNVLTEQDDSYLCHISPEYNGEINLEQLIEPLGREPKAFSIIDLDNDSLPEVVLALGEYKDEFIILKYYHEHVYAYERYIRGFGDLKRDGTFDFNSSAWEGGAATLLFQGDTTGEDVKVYSNQSTTIFKHGSSINGQSATREKASEAMDYQWSKPDATWYDFSEENIKKYLSDTRR